MPPSSCQSLAEVGNYRYGNHTTIGLEVLNTPQQLDDNHEANAVVGSVFFSAANCSKNFSPNWCAFHFQVPSKQLTKTHFPPKKNTDTLFSPCKTKTCSNIKKKGSRILCQITRSTLRHMHLSRYEIWIVWPPTVYTPSASRFSFFSSRFCCLLLALREWFYIVHGINVSPS